MSMHIACIVHVFENPLQCFIMCKKELVTPTFTRKESNAHFCCTVVVFFFLSLVWPFVCFISFVFPMHTIQFSFTFRSHLQKWRKKGEKKEWPCYELMNINIKLKYVRRAKMKQQIFGHTLNRAKKKTTTTRRQMNKAIANEYEQWVTRLCWPFLWWPLFYQWALFTKQ